MDTGSISHTIICTTCQGRLVVRSASAVGQILPCPKCGSMVMVTPPAAPADPLSEKARAASAAAAPAGLADTIDDSAVLSPGEIQPPAPPVQHSGAEPMAGPLLPSQAAVATPSWRLPLIWSGAGGAVVVVVIFVWAYIASRPERPAPTAQGPNETFAGDETAASQEQEAEPEESSPHETNSEPTSPPNTADEEESATPEDPSAAAGNVDLTEQPADPADTEAPIEIDETVSSLPATELSDIFGQFDEVVEPDISSSSPQPDALADGDDADFLRDWPVVPLRPRPEFRPVDVEARLQDPIASITLPETPLRDLLHLMSGMTTIPIVIDPEALVHAEVSLLAPTRVSLQNTTVGEILATALATHGLVLQPAEGCAIVQKAAPPEGLRTVSYDLADLCSGDLQQLEELADLLRTFVAPESWSEQGDPATLSLDGTTVVVRQTEPAHYQIMLLCQKLRLARGLPPQGPPSLVPFTLASRTAQMSEKLATPIRLNYPDPVPLRQILNRLEQEADIVLLVDWKALAEISWPSTADATLAVDNATLAEALHQLLASMELTWRAVDGGMLEITSVPALAERLEFEIYPLDPAVVGTTDPRQVADLIALDLGLTHFQRGGGSGRLWFDPESSSLLVRLSQLQQRELEQLLEGWRPIDAG